MELPGIVSTYIETFCRGDLDACLATFAPDGMYISASTTHTFSGQAIKDLFSEYFTGFPDLTCETVAVHAISEDLAVWRWVVRGTHTGSFRGLPPTGRSVVLRGCDFISVRQGLVQRVEGYVDRLGLLQQLGALPAPEQSSQFTLRRFCGGDEQFPSFRGEGKKGAFPCRPKTTRRSCAVS